MPDLVAREAPEDGDRDAPADLPGEFLGPLAFQRRLIVTDYRLRLLLEILQGY